MNGLGNLPPKEQHSSPNPCFGLEKNVLVQCVSGCRGGPPIISAGRLPGRSLARLHTVLSLEEQYVFPEPKSFGSADGWPEARALFESEDGNDNEFDS
jgi:hypothetical protein